jgi:hypothetical protein
LSFTSLLIFLFILSFPLILSLTHTSAFLFIHYTPGRSPTAFNRRTSTIGFLLIRSPDLCVPITAKPRLPIRSIVRRLVSRGSNASVSVSDPANK